MDVSVNGKKHKVRQNVTLAELSKRFGPTESPVMAACINGRIIDLEDPVTEPCEIGFITLKDREGFRVYIRTLSYVFVLAMYHVLGREVRVRIMHSINGNLYCEARKTSADGAPVRVLTKDELQAVEQEMDRLIEANLPIKRRHVLMNEAMWAFASHDMPDMERLFRYRSTSGVNLYYLDGEFNYFYGNMLPFTGMLLPGKRLTAAGDGLMLLTPSRVPPHEVRPLHKADKLYEVFSESKKWSRVIGVEDVGSLNDIISAGRINELIMTSEALHAKKIAEIASEIASRGKIKLVLIAGPSSSGKTTFAQRLMVALRAEGYFPHLISMDNYFVNRADTPLDEEGKPDYECLQAVDTAQFNEDMSRLMKGETVEIPTYDFITGERTYPGKNVFRLEERHILVVEGIHGMNEEVSSLVPKENKYKIFISALAFLNVDDHNRISSTDGRLLRRIIRDNQHRGHSAAKTISMWPSVRKGEEKNIFPFEDEADVAVNSAHLYELAVIKQFALPLLYQIRPEEPEYAEARRLIKFLDFFLGVSPEAIPRESLLREFIGGGIFEQ